METQAELKQAPAPEKWPTREPRPYGRPIAEIMADLTKPPHPKHLGSKRVQGTQLTFCPWYHTANYLDLIAPGWSSEVTEMHTTGDRVFVTVRLTIPAAEGTFCREATGTETLKRTDKETGEEKEIAYGDPSSNAEGMAFRRAAAKWGFCRYLYYKK